MSLNSFFNPFGKCLIFLSKQARTMFKHIKGPVAVCWQCCAIASVWPGLTDLRPPAGKTSFRLSKASLTALLLGVSFKQNQVDVSSTHLSTSKVTDKKNYADMAIATFKYKIHEPHFKHTRKDSFSYSTNHLHCSGQSSNRHLTTHKKSLQQLSLDCWTARIVVG